MAAGLTRGVILVPSPAAVPRPPSPGLTVVVAADPRPAAVGLATSLGAGEPVSLAAARTELERRRATTAGRAVALRARTAAVAEVAASRDALHRAEGAVPAALLGTDPGRLRRAAAAVVAGRATLHAERAGLGEQPNLDPAAAEAAHDADARVRQAVADRAAGMDRALAGLAVANLSGVALVGGRLWDESFDAIFFLVGVLPLAALGALVHGVAVPGRRARSAARRRAEALRALGLTTMAGLAARQARAGRWARRAALVAAVEAELTGAEAEWRAVAGGALEPEGAEEVAEQVERVAAARARLAAAEAALGHASGPAPASDTALATEPAGAGPLVVVDTLEHAGRGARRAVLGRLAGLSQDQPVLLVTSSAETRAWAATGRGQGGVGGVVDLTGRVRDGLLRLRARTVQRRPPSPGPVASGE